MSNQKPWTDLTRLERRVKIALRLPDWRLLPIGSTEYWYSDKPNTGCPFVRYLSPKKIVHSADALPNWPTNDGLAFEEVWPKVLGQCNLSRLMFACPPTVPAVWTQYRSRPHPVLRDTEEYIWEMVKGKTWAEAICHAWYKLKEVPDERED